MARTLEGALGPLTWAMLLTLLGLLGAGATAFLRPPIEKLPPETIPRTAPASWALPAGQVVLLVPEGSDVPASWPYAQRIRESELRAAGFTLVRTAAELEEATEAGAVVIWVHRDAVPMVDANWLRSRYHEGHAIGVIDGTMTDLRAWFGIGPGAGGWLRQSSPRPIFALVHEQRCALASGGFQDGSGAISEHFTLGWVIAVSNRAVRFCGR